MPTAHRQDRPLRPDQPAAAGGPGSCVRASQTVGVQPVRLEVLVRTIDLAQADERLDRVRPDRKRRIVDSACEEASGEVAQVVCGGFQIAELELEAAEDTDRLDREDPRTRHPAQAPGPRRRRHAPPRRDRGRLRGAPSHVPPSDERERAASAPSTRMPHRHARPRGSSGRRATRARSTTRAPSRG